MKKFMSGLVALAVFVIAVPMGAQAGADLVPYKPGIIKSAISKGETALLFFKSSW